MINDGRCRQRFIAFREIVGPIQVIHRPRMGIIRPKIFYPGDLVPGNFEIEGRLSVRQQLNNKQGDIQGIARDKRVLGPEPLVPAEGGYKFAIFLFQKVLNGKLMIGRAGGDGQRGPQNNIHTDPVFPVCFF